MKTIFYLTVLVAVAAAAPGTYEDIYKGLDRLSDYYGPVNHPPSTISETRGQGPYRRASTDCSDHREQINLASTASNITFDLSFKIYNLKYPGIRVHQGSHLTAKIQDRGYGLGSFAEPRIETEPELYFILRSPKPRGSVWSSDRFNRGLV